MDNNDISMLIKRIERLEAEIFGNKVINTKNSIKNPKKQKNPPLNFSINVRAFVQKFATKKSGAKKFVLLLAFLTKGEIGKNVAVTDIRKEWNKMSGKKMLGKFNTFHPNSAKTKGWVDSEKSGIYCLTDNWQEAYE